MAAPGKFRRSLALLRRLLLENAREFWLSYAVAISLLVIVSGATALTAYLMKDVINEIFVNRERDAIIWIAGAVAALFAIKGASAYGSAVLLGRIGNRIISKLQGRMFHRIIHQSLAFFSDHDAGILVTRFTHHAEAARSAIEQVIVSFSRDILTLAGLVTVMIIQDPFLSVFSLLIAPPAVLLTMGIMRRIKKVAKAEVALLGEKTQILKEAILGIRVVKAFGIEDRMDARMGDAIHRFEGRANHIVRLSAISVPMMEALGGVAVAAAIYYGGFAVMDRGAEPGAFFSFIAALLMAYDPARRLARFNVTFQRNLVGVELLYEMIDAPNSETGDDDAPALEVAGGRIRFDDVRFSYGDGAALNRLTLEFAPGETTALVGASGAGKSTILSLIARFYDPQGGAITIDGQRIDAVSLTSLRRRIALVTQETFLFNGTIRENILVGRPNATDDELIAAAKAANAHDFIMECPAGYDERVGDGGERLSGGQRQRVSIARAMLRDAPILLLDEATSALDTVSEAKVQEALKRLMADRTTIVIAHRLATVWHADRIHVIERGALAESGRHQDLVARGGLYARLSQVQMAPSEAATPETEDEPDADAPVAPR